MKQIDANCGNEKTAPKIGALELDKIQGITLRPFNVH